MVIQTYFVLILTLVSLLVKGQDQVKDQYKVYVVQEGWHTGIIIRTSDVPVSVFQEVRDYMYHKYVDISWGDEKYYQHPDPGIYLTLRAIVWPTQAVIRINPFSREPKNYYGQSTIMEFTIDRARFMKLCQFISGSFVRDDQGEVIASTYLVDSHNFFLARRKYSIFRTCNTWVLQAFKMADYDIHSFLGITANQLFRRLNKLNESEFLQKQE